MPAAASTWNLYCSKAYAAAREAEKRERANPKPPEREFGAVREG